MADVQSNIKVSIDTTEALASIKNLQRQISAFHTSMARGGAAANAVTSQMQQNLINSINATGKFSAQMRTIKTTTESFTSSLEKNKFSMREYFRYAGGASKTFGKLFKTEFETINKVARENVKDLQTQYISMGRDASGAMKAISVRPLSLDMNNLATKTMIASQRQAILNQLLKQGSTNLLNFGKNTQWAGRQLMVGFTVPLMALGAAASKTFMDMETQAIRFKKVYGDLFTSTTESTAALDAIKNLGKEFTKYGIAVSDTVGLASEAAAAGYKGIDLQRQTAAATKLSILGQVESQKALETTIALQNAFSMSSADLATNIDFLNAVENQTVLSLDDMSTAIPKAAPVIQQLGGDVKDLAFFMAAMKEGGINASEGANALKSGLASMINPTGKASAMLESFGINIKKIVVDNKGDLKKTVIDFATALNKLDPLNRAQAIEQMFGKFQFARLSTLFANVTKEGTQAARVLDLAGSSIQDLAALSEKELGQTSESAMNKFKASVENLKLSLVPVGEEFLKAVTPIAQFIADILEKFNNLGSGTKKTIVMITAIVGGLGPVLLMTFGLLANGVANIIKGFTAIKSLFNKTGQASSTLGTQVSYMTTEQRDAAAVAASLDQVHRKLAQTFTAEANAVDRLTAAYSRSIAAQRNLVPTGVPMGRGPIKKYATGKPAVVGGTGNEDSELAYLMPGETVIPTKMSKKYASLINGMINDTIPGYRQGKGTGTAVAIPGGFAAAHFGGSSYRTGAELLQMIEGVDTAYAKQIRRMITELDGFSRRFTVFSNEVIGTSTELNQAVGKTGSGKTAPIALAKRDLIGPGAVTRDIELQRQLEAAGVSIEEIRVINKKVTSSIKDGFKKLGNKATITAEDLDKLVNDAYSEVSKTDDRVKSARERMRGITTVTDPRGDSRIAVSKDPYTKSRKSGAYYAGMERSAGAGNVPYQKNAAFKITNAMAASVGLSSKETALVYNQMSQQAKIALSKLKGDVAAFSLEFERQALAAGLKVGNAYKIGIDKSGLKDIYVESRDRKSPHRLVPQDGKDDARAYNAAVDKELKKGGKKGRIAPIIPVSAVDPRIIPFSDPNTQSRPPIITPIIPPGYNPPEGPMYGPRKPTKFDKTFGKLGAKIKSSAANGGIRGPGMGLSTVGMMASSAVPGKTGQVLQQISMIGFALSALQQPIAALILKFGLAAVSLTAVIALSVLSIGAGMYLFNKSAKKAGEEIIESSKREVEARVGSARAVEQFAKTFNKALPSEREFSRNASQGIKASGSLVDQYAKDYATEGNISRSIINQAAFKSQKAGINAIAIDVANKAAILGLSPEEIAAMIKAASNLIGADQIKVKAKIQQLLAPGGKDILKEPLTIDARINYLNTQSTPSIEGVNEKITGLGNIDYGSRFGLFGKYDYASLKKDAEKQKAIDDSFAKNTLMGDLTGIGQDALLGIEAILGINGESIFSSARTSVVKDFTEIQKQVADASIPISVGFMQQREALALLNAQYADGQISTENYDKQMKISETNFDNLKKSSLNLVKQLNKVDSTGGLASESVKGLGDAALGAIKQANPAMFDQITAAMNEMDAAGKVDLYIGYMQGSLTMYDLLLLPGVLKEITGKPYQVAIDIITGSGLSPGGQKDPLIATAEASVKRLESQLAEGKFLDHLERLSIQRQLQTARQQIVDAEAAAAKQRRVNQVGQLNSDLDEYQDITEGSTDASNAYVDILQKEIDALKAKRDAQKDANDEVQREIDLKMKLQDLANEAVQAKISGNYLKAATLTQEAQNIQMKYNQETELKKKDAQIAKLEARLQEIEDGAVLTKAENAKLKAAMSAKKVKAASGGHILGAGTATSDSIPAMLSNGEYVIKASSVKKYGTETFDALNAGKYADGGIIQGFWRGGLARAVSGFAKAGVSNISKTIGSSIKGVPSFLSRLGENLGGNPINALALKYASGDVPSWIANRVLGSQLHGGPSGVTNFIKQDKRGWNFPGTYLMRNRFGAASYGEATRSPLGASLYNFKAKESVNILNLLKKPTDAQKAAVLNALATPGKPLYGTPEMQQLIAQAINEAKTLDELLHLGRSYPGPAGLTSSRTPPTIKYGSKKGQKDSQNSHYQLWRKSRDKRVFDAIGVTSSETDLVTNMLSTNMMYSGSHQETLNLLEALTASSKHGIKRLARNVGDDTDQSIITNMEKFFINKEKKIDNTRFPGANKKTQTMIDVMNSVGEAGSTYAPSNLSNWIKFLKVNANKKSFSRDMYYDMNQKMFKNVNEFKSSKLLLALKDYYTTTPTTGSNFWSKNKKGNTTDAKGGPVNETHLRVSNYEKDKFSKMGIPQYANGGSVQGFWRGGLARGVAGFAKKGMSKVSPFLKQLAFAIPNKINEIKNYLKVRSMIKDGMWHGSQPTGGRGEEYLQGKNILDGAETYDPHYGMGFFGTSSKSEADMYAAGYNSSTNWGEAFGSVNKITKAPFGKYVDFTRGTNSIKWQNYKLYQALGMEKDGYLNSYLPENLGDIMAGQNITGSIMKRISDGQVPGDMGSAKWLAWSKPAGVHTEEYTGGRYAPKKPASLLDNLKSKLSLLKKPKGFNVGGHIKGAGTATSDSIPAYLSDGEYVIKASSVKKYGTETFDALNAQKFQTGGEVHKHPYDRGPAVRQDPVLARIRKNRYLHGPGLNRDGNPAGWNQIFKKENWEKTANFFGLPGIGKTLQDMKTYGGPLGLGTARFDQAMSNIFKPNNKKELPMKSSIEDNIFTGLAVAPIGRPLARGANWLMEKIGNIIPQGVKTGTAKFLASQGIDIFTKASDKLKTFAKPNPVVPEAPSSLSTFEGSLKNKMANAITLSMAKRSPESAASTLARRYPESAAQIRAKLIPNHILRKNFEDIKKISQPGSLEWEQSRIELAISDALKAAKESGVIPLMDLKNTRFEQLLAESRALPSIIEEPVTIGGKDYIFKFTKGELGPTDRYNVDNYLETIRGGYHGGEGVAGWYAKHEAQILDPVSGYGVAHIRYDPVTGSISNRGTDKDFQKMGISAFLYNKVASFTRIKHSNHLSDMGRASADRMGGFLAQDPVSAMYNSVDLSMLPKFKVPSLPKFKVPSLPKFKAPSLKEYLGKLTGKLKKPNKTDKNITIIDRGSDPNWIGNAPVYPARPAADTTMSSRAANGAPRASEEARLQREVDQARRGREMFGRSPNTAPTGHHMTDFTNTYLDYLDSGGILSPLDFMERLYIGGPTRRSTGAAKGGLITQRGLINKKAISARYNLPSFATGIDYLPNDMIAQLHQGERVLTKEENKTYSSSAPTTNIININGSDLNKKEIAQAVMVELDRAQKKNNKTNMVGR